MHRSMYWVSLLFGLIASASATSDVAHAHNGQTDGASAIVPPTCSPSPASSISSSISSFPSPISCSISSSPSPVLPTSPSASPLVIAETPPSTSPVLSMVVEGQAVTRPGMWHHLRDLGRSEDEQRLVWGGIALAAFLLVLCVCCLCLRQHFGSTPAPIVPMTSAAFLKLQAQLQPAAEPVWSINFPAEPVWSINFPAADAPATPPTPNIATVATSTPFTSNTGTAATGTPFSTDTVATPSIGAGPGGPESPDAKEKSHLQEPGQLQHRNKENRSRWSKVRRKMMFRRSEVEQVRPNTRRVTDSFSMQSQGEKEIWIHSLGAVGEWWLADCHPVRSGRWSLGFSDEEEEEEKEKKKKEKKGEDDHVLLGVV
eukprot:g34390.t1